MRTQKFKKVKELAQGSKKYAKFPTQVFLFAELNSSLCLFNHRKISIRDGGILKFIILKL